MNILMIYPRFSDTFWSLKDLLKILSRKAAFPPLGLLTIAAMLPESWAVKLIDMNVGELSGKDIVWADYVFIGAMITQKDSAKEVITRCKNLGRSVVLGGPILENGFDEFPDVSHFFVGEAEDMFPAFLADIEAKKAKRVYSSECHPDIAASPVPRWDLVDPQKYVSAMVQCNRGCPYRCKFCSVAKLNGHKLRAKSPEQFLREIESAHKAGFRGPLFIADDNFIGDKRRVKEVLRQLAEWQEQHEYPFSITTEADITLADDLELMDLMVNAGFRQVFLGLETPNKATLIEWGKLQNARRDLVACVKEIQRHGLIPMSGFIVGGDNDPPDIADQMIRFIQETGIVVAMVSMLQAIPGTELYDILQRQGRLLALPSGDNTDYPNFNTKMPPATLVREYKRIVMAIYSPKEYYKRICNLLENYDPSGRPKKKFSLIDLGAFMRANLQIGLLGGLRAGYYYWKTLLSAFFKHRQAFSEAVAAQIYGAHFRRRAKRIQES